MGGVQSSDSGLCMCAMVVPRTQLVRVGGVRMALLNGELAHTASPAVCPHHIASTPSQKAGGKEPAPHCANPCLCAAGCYDTGRTSKHTALSRQEGLQKGEKRGRETCWQALVFFLVYCSGLNSLSTGFFFSFPKRSTKYILPFFLRPDLKVSISSAWGK